MDKTINLKFKDNSKETKISSKHAIIKACHHQDKYRSLAEVKSMGTKQKHQKPTTNCDYRSTISISIFFNNPANQH